MFNITKGTQKLPLQRRAPTIAIIIMMLCFVASEPISFASPANPSKNTKTLSITTPEKESSYTLSLKQLGAGETIYLVGENGKNVINFNVPADEVIAESSINIQYKYSPDLVEKLSKINVYLNGEVIKSIATPKSDGNQNLEVVIPIPPQLFSEKNQFTFQLIGHYASDCEDPNSPKLWATISNISSMKLNTLPLMLPNELANLPIPFANKSDSRKLLLPFVFMGKPSNASLEAAGILSSWLGSNSSQSGSKFPVTISSIPPTGNAIIFIDPSASVAGITLPNISGPMIFIINNPKDPYGKLLFVAGRDGKELKQAASAIALDSQSLSGQIAFITPSEIIPRRKPYDAPNWLNGNGPIQLSELSSNPKVLNASGIEQYPILLNVQIPPALYSSKNKGIPLHFGYSYTNQYKSLGSKLTVNYKNQYIKSISLPMRYEWLSNWDFGNGLLANGLGLSRSVDNLLSNITTAYIPMTVAYPHLKTKSKPILQLSFAIHQDKNVNLQRSDCPSSFIKENIQAVIHPNSIIDISGMQHFIEMPNLSAFSDSGFPFSRLADLAETAVVLPDTPSTNDYEAYLALVAHIGNLTGYPGTSLEVTNASNLNDAKDKDLLVITSGKSNQSLLSHWERIIPSQYQRDFSSSSIVSNIANLFSSNLKFDIYNNAFIAGFESPLKEGRSVVLVSSSDPKNLKDLTDALDGSLGPIYGSLSTLSDEHIQVVTDRQTYHVGDLSWQSYIPWLISKYLVLFMLISAIAATMLSLLIYAGLKAKRRQRLQ